MAVVRYRVDGVPAQYQDAWFPMPTLSPAGATSVSRFTFGAPGTEPVPSPRPAGSGTVSDSREWAPPSAVAPTTFNPQLYINDIRQLGPPVHYMPGLVAQLVPPVGEVGGVSDVAMNGRRAGGKRAMFWKRNSVQWPNILGGT